MRAFHTSKTLRAQKFSSIKHVVPRNMNGRSTSPIVFFALFAS